MQAHGSAPTGRGMQLLSWHQVDLAGAEPGSLLAMVATYGEMANYMERIRLARPVFALICVSRWNPLQAFAIP
ncbi:hypothetical protein [Ktedonobacter sp. SOSP1-52]|uniref:hypothetical protein n=1 Tax=Ktedonobacter sp. SOSP1-52 TaxID=2778366 RepID=UPI001914F364|nr:hypothetical protein [Ktedonobacter sp. SOSP1-52]